MRETRIGQGRMGDQELALERRRGTRIVRGQDGLAGSTHAQNNRKEKDDAVERSHAGQHSMAGPLAEPK